MSYEFVKVYADLVADDGSVLVLYHAWVRFFRRWYTRGGYELYRPDGTARVRHGKIAAAPPPPDQVLERPLALGQKHGELRLVLERCDAAFEPDTQPVSGLEWRVLAARTRAHSEGLDGGELTGSGYVDWVRIVRATRRLGLRDLSWGRAHLGHTDLVWNAIELQDGSLWSRVVRHADGVVRTVPGRIAVGDDGSGRIDLDGEALTLESARMLTRGASLSRERLPGAIERAVARLVGGPTDEVRWVGRARLGDEGGRALWERVRFG